MKRISLPACLLLSAILVVPLAAHVQLQRTPPNILKEASANGKYAMLLKQIAVPQDTETYGIFADSGYWQGTEWAGFKDLPQGYWVYMKPYWYIWRDLTA